VQVSAPSLSWFARSVLTIPSGMARLALPADLALRVLRRSAATPLLSWLAPGWVIVGRREGAAADPAVDADSSSVALWPAGAGHGPGDGGHDLPSLEAMISGPGIRTVVLGASKDPNAKLSVLVWPAGEPVPDRVVKVPTTERAAAAVAAEEAALLQLSERLQGPLRETVPTVLGRADAWGRPALVMGALPGTPMATLYHRYRHTADQAAVAADFEAAGDWLAAFQQSTAAGSHRLSAGDGLAARLSGRFPDAGGLDEVLASMGLIEDRLGQVTVADTAVHGDYWFGNLLVRDGRVSGVVDWEAAEAVGSPIRDLGRFVLSYALYLDRHTRPGRRVAGHPGLRAGDWGAGVIHALGGDGWFPSTVRRFLEVGLRRLGIPDRLWRDVALAAVAEVAAGADHPEFAKAHFDLLQRLVAA
jgi:hypothetical protein